MNPNSIHQGDPEGELFLNSASRPPAESPVVGPLRISKRDTPSPASQGSAPLPYPDDRPRLGQMRSSSGSTGSSPTAGESGRHGSPISSVNNLSSMPAGSSATRPSEYPAALRPRDGREPKPATLAERRGNTAPKPLPESPGPDAPDREALFGRKYQRLPASSALSSDGMQREEGIAYPDYQQQYWPPPQPSTPSALSTRVGVSQSLQPPSSTINRISSTASNSTTRAQRGSPPPPETPIVGPGQQPGSDIEARYAASGIAGTSTLAGLHAQSAAAQRRAEPYAGQLPRTQQHQFPTQRPWTPTEQPGSQPHGPPTVYQGAEAVESRSPNPPASSYQPPPPQPVATPPHAAAQGQQPPRIPPKHWSKTLKGCVLVPRLLLRTRVYPDLLLPKAIPMKSSVCRLPWASQLLQQAIQQPWLLPLLLLLLRRSRPKIIRRLPTNPGSSPRQVFHHRMVLRPGASLPLCRMHQPLPCPAHRRFLQPLRRRSQKGG